MAQLLAKPDITLFDHLQEVARLGNELTKRLNLPEHLRVKAILACALHDIGKATEGFQEHIRGKQKTAYPHPLASFPFVFLAEKYLDSYYGWEPTSLEATASVISHHSPLSPRLYINYDNPPDYCPELQELLYKIWSLLEDYQLCGLPSFDKFWEKVQPFLQNSLSAFLDTSLEFDKEYRTLRGIFQRLNPAEFAQVKTVLHLADWLASAKQHQISILFLDGGKNIIEKHILQKFDVSLRKFQREALDASSKTDILWLRAPTGTGKTEALLSWASNTERILYLLPTQATADAMWRRLRKIYGDNAVGLAHGRATYILHREFEENYLDLRLFGSVFAKPVIVGTIDQYLLSHLNGRHWEERRTLAKRATIIIDEIHAYEPYTLGLLHEALKREQPVRIAIASATLPKQLLDLFPKGKLIEAEENLWQRQRYSLEIYDGTLFENGIEKVIQFAKQGKKVLVVANTVQGAQDFYKKLREEVGWTKSNLLHARFIFRDRLSKAEKVEKPENGMIFVATQVVEVSLDISYDVLVTEVAPLDALVQRMGRVNRYGQDQNLRAPVIIFKNWTEGSKHIYGENILKWSLNILEKLPKNPTDNELAQACQDLYALIMSTDEWKKEFEEGRNTLNELQQTLGCYTIDLNEEKMRNFFAARRGAVSIEILPSQFVEQVYKLKNEGQGWRLPEFLVPVPIYWLKKSEFFFYSSDLECVLTSLHYNCEYGLKSPMDQSKFPGGIFFD